MTVTRECFRYVWMAAIGMMVFAASVSFAALDTAAPGFAVPAAFSVDDSAGDDDGNAQPGETVTLSITISTSINDGVADAEVSLASNSSDLEVATDPIEVATWSQGESITFDFDVNVAATLDHQDTVTESLVLTITATDEPSRAYTRNLDIYPGPNFELVSFWLNDFAFWGGDFDGVAEPGERIQPRIRVSNTGGGSGTDLTLTLTSQDPSITIEKGTITVASWSSGQVRSDTGLRIQVSSAPSVSSVPMQLAIAAPSGRTWTVSFSITVHAPNFELLSFWLNDFAFWGGDFDQIAEQGERIQPRLRIKNTGNTDVTNATVTVQSLDNSSITIEKGSISVASWSAGQTRNDTGMRIQVASAPAATSVSMQATVTVGDRSWTLPFTITIQTPNFKLLSFWLNDFAFWGGDFDQIADPGERIQPRLRIQNFGNVAASDATVTVQSLDTSSITIEKGTITVASWSAGQTRSDTGLRIQVSATPTTTSVPMQVIVSAGGRSWTLPFTVTIGSPNFSLSSFWLNDFTIWGGDFDGIAESGELVQPRIRVKNISGSTLSNVSVSIQSLDSSIVVEKASITVASWSAGQTRSDTGLRFRVAASPTLSSVPMRLTLIVPTVPGSEIIDFNIPIGVAPAPAKLDREEMQPFVNALLPNYPNPFNPETWIPFELSESTDVTVRVYAQNGALVRELRLGSHEPGRYVNRTDAAYWDGKTDLGEPVGSGVYFYVISAGSFRATRRMLVLK